MPPPPTKAMATYMYTLCMCFVCIGRYTTHTCHNNSKQSEQAAPAVRAASPYPRFSSCRFIQGWNPAGATFRTHVRELFLRFRKILRREIRVTIQCIHLAFRFTLYVYYHDFWNTHRRIFANLVSKHWKQKHSNTCTCAITEKIIKLYCMSRFPRFPPWIGEFATDISIR